MIVAPRHIVVAASFHISPLSQALSACVTRLWPGAELTLLPPGGLSSTLSTRLRSEYDTAYVLLVRSTDVPLVTAAAAPEYRESFIDALEAITDAAHCAALVVGLVPDGQGAAPILSDSEVLECRRRGIQVFSVDPELVRTIDLAAPSQPSVVLASVGYSALATAIIVELLRATGAPRKVLVTDCDGTLWEGECGEDGVQGIHIRDGHRAFQQFLSRQAAKGVLIAVCSKNDRKDVLAVFDENPGMQLRSSDVASWAVSWDRKWAGVQAIADDLGLPLDAMAMFDDDPSECGDLRTLHPELMVLQIPDNAERLPGMVARCSAIDSLNASTAEDGLRSAWHQAELQRRGVEARTASLEQFLNNIDFRCNARSATPADVPRICQLLQRTNQFNSTRQAWSEHELEERLSIGAVEAWVCTARDQFAEYGIVAAAIGQWESTHLGINPIAMSCRVIRRHVEDTLLVHLSRCAFVRGVERLSILVRHTGRNGRFLEFVTRLASHSTAVATATSIELVPDEIIRNARYVRSGAILGEYDGLSAVRIERTPVVTPVLFDVRAVEAFVAAGIQAWPRGDAHDDVELLVRGIWIDVLRTAAASTDDEFYTSGGDSIGALDMLYRINERLSVEIPLTVLFEPAITLGYLISLAQVLRAGSKIEAQARSLSDPI